MRPIRSVKSLVAASCNVAELLKCLASPIPCLNTVDRWRGIACPACSYVSWARQQPTSERIALPQSIVGTALRHLTISVFGCELSTRYCMIRPHDAAFNLVKLMKRSQCIDRRYFLLNPLASGHLGPVVTAS